MYATYKDWCALNRFSPESARRFYGSIWDIFRIKMEKSNGRRLFKGIQLLPVEEPALSLSKGPEGEPALNAGDGGAQGAGRGQE